jgi:probable HAF family extracellular repeat protein
MCVAVFSAGTAGAAEVRFQGLPMYPGGEGSVALGVSRDGSTVVGQALTTPVPNPPTSLAQEQGVYWRNGQITALGDLSGGGDASAAISASSDGSVIVGGGNQFTLLPNPNGTIPPPTTIADAQPVRWVNGVISALEAPAGYHAIRALGVSADGSVVVGEGIATIGQTPQGQPITRAEGFRWANGVMTRVGVLPGGGGSRATGISADGSVIVGDSFANSGDIPFRWENGVTTPLNIGGGLIGPTATAVSSDGRVIVGAGSGAAAMQSYRLENGVTELLSSFGRGSFATAVSGDGSVIVGWADVGDGPTRAFVWDAAHGMRDLQNLLQNVYGLDLSGWNLLEATGVSDDGRTIIGWGTSPISSGQAFLVTLPEPAALSVLVPGVILILRRRRLVGRRMF